VLAFRPLIKNAPPLSACLHPLLQLRCTTFPFSSSSILPFQLLFPFRLLFLQALLQHALPVPSISVLRIHPLHVDAFPLQLDLEHMLRQREHDPFVALSPTLVKLTFAKDQISRLQLTIALQLFQPAHDLLSKVPLLHRTPWRVTSTKALKQIRSDIIMSE
jgi:hypothetical protein